MKTTSAVLAATALAGSAYAQANIGSIAQTALSYLSPTCLQTVIQLSSNGSALNTCLDGSLLESIVLGNGSIIAPVGNYLDEFCSSQPCSNETLTNATQTLLSGCASDLTKFGVTNQTIEFVVAQYPLARDVLCLKTTDPFVGNGTSSSNMTSMMNSTSSSNSTNGTFCATSLLTEFQSYLGEDLTISNIATIALGGNQTALDTIKSIPPTALCDECVFGALSLVEEQYPQLGNITLGNYTLNTFLTGTCNATNGTEFTLSTNGTLPTNVTESAVNSTLIPMNFTMPQTNLSIPTQFKMNSSASSTGAVESVLSSVVATASGSAVTAMKKRWIGQQ
ncbi:uncharacterized protein IL334_005593 [Kwoniella shivajii]|uniref:Uncharacterized protein n=1 Tax=Kwoniella shivajii TaxID=564305 RepID=A0ABZ1D5F7_9TREE|nr:hypothetical protein IL334_005593 [Kwoniella shivajii]